ncbi:interferon-inducible GTPase 5-like [Hemicordylus capensis]|uniref:interferon-inducible GTPase 5-like n=1 Tax=Hemicordylus capensis TaxID=884348 RepID=UPI0023038976|nr:interferon-inducible GTPase 5-like [Hemicordylus capensis]XP_053123649.1 interferon-inducible GTPase 5-like [Hemicordylus capensis]XP_053123650.1 interferon-inducible GTPase 5-like [Hemicordylus capensis]XP_053123651.1 interferon-inducible GTPase 5-like [Hemicordylus capensis]XP_053123652.1 interferon-inducible GTPase 5-like [Hemicordylus capensis]
MLRASALEIPELDLREMGTMIQSRVVVEVSGQVQSLLDSLETTTLEIAVTGESGAGKSTFINALLGLNDGDHRAALTGVIETTTSPTPYQHPHLPNVRLWDLPGTGTPCFQAEKYLRQVGFESYDFFIIVASERFRQNHAELARAVGAMGKRFYFVRSKVDQDLRASQRRRPARFQEVQVLREIEADCIHQLRNEGLASPKVFLVSSFELHKFDFQRLQDTLADELEGHKRHALLLSFPSVTAAAVQKKKDSLHRHIWKKALLACFVSALPGLPIHLNIPMLMRTLLSYHRSFGLDDESLGALAVTASKPHRELKDQVCSALGKDLSENTVQAILSQAAVYGQVAARLVKNKVPLLDNLVAGGVSFVAAYYLLHTALDSFAQDAQRVLGRAYELEDEVQGSLCYPPEPGFIYD